MEFFIFLAVISIVFLPLILSIVAMTKVGGLRNELQALRRQMEMNDLLKSRPVEKPPAPEPIRNLPTESKSAQHPPPSTPAIFVETENANPVEPIKVSPPITKPPSSGEFVFGGRVASFAGIGLLLIGVALLVGYAIKHAWLGPQARVILGLLSGLTLVGLGHLAETKGKGKLAILARSLTGGGSALFYFCVFAAFGIYHLIGATTAGIGLVLSAAAAFALAFTYRSQAVAVIAVIGAFIMPPLIGRELPNLLFLLTYMAVINVPVIIFGIYRNWQSLYNVAFAFTVVYMIGQISIHGQSDGGLLALFSVVYFLQFAVLGLFKLRAESDISGRDLDVVRLLINSLGLLGALYAIMEKMAWDAWTGTTFLAASVLHLILLRIGWKWRPSFDRDQLAFLVGAVTFASLALPAQLDGAWVSLGWGVEGAILCWFALRARIPLLKAVALVLGFIGLMKSLVFDLQLYLSPPPLFLNARFGSGLLAAVLLGVQSVLHARYSDADEDKADDLWTILPPLAVLSALLVFAADIFWTLGSRNEWAWILSSIILITVTTASALTMKKLPFMDSMCRCLLIAIPLKLLWDMLSFSNAPGWASQKLFISAPFISLVMMSAFSLFLIPRLLESRANIIMTGAKNFSQALKMISLFSAIIIVTAEIYRFDNDWHQAFVTLWWAACAIALAITGLILKQRPNRYAGLWLFGLMTAKVLLVDLAALSGLERIAAFIGAGIILLILSFIYQRASATLID
ncbi:MAG TPA: DUF2339 domain-containing protein [Kiritimatiellia bacterium]|nr:DUF2339 domain-containing protein [Kiritimatiellia bacterium]